MAPAHILSLPIQRRNCLYLYINLPTIFTIASNPHSSSLKLVGQIQSSTEETKALGSLCDLSEGTACEGGATPSSWVFRLLILLFPRVSNSGLFSSKQLHVCTNPPSWLSTGGVGHCPLNLTLHLTVVWL